MSIPVGRNWLCLGICSASTPALVIFCCFTKQPSTNLQEYLYLYLDIALFVIVFGICAAFTPALVIFWYFTQPSSKQALLYFQVKSSFKRVRNQSLLVFGILNLVFGIWYLRSLNPSAGHILVFHTASKSSRPKPA